MKSSSLLIVALLIAGSGYTQQCGTNMMLGQLKQQNHAVSVLEEQLEQEIKARILHGNLNRFAKGTEVNTDTVYHIPLVVHVIHDYGQEYISDDVIYQAVDDLNRMFSRTNSDSTGIIPPYNGVIPGTNITYRGKANIQFHLASKDPQGNPTHGITRTRSYLTYNAHDYSKLGQWPPSDYINIWVVNSAQSFLFDVYAYMPSMAAINPYNDGLIIAHDGAYTSFNRNHNISHGVGHMLGLLETYGNSQGTCGDDSVDDTPPTKGSLISGCNLQPATYDTSCALGYSKTYTSAESYALFGDTTHHFVNYPDTVNTQNIMNEFNCAKMFTYGQVLRMRSTLNSSVGSRNLLMLPANLAATGVLASRIDLPPVADFYVVPPFRCIDQYSSGNTYFISRSWNDTVVNAQWTFTNGAFTPTSSSLTSVQNSFTQSGWVAVSLTVTGNNTGSSTITKNNVLYIADTGRIIPGGGAMSFDDSNITKKWPIFNYYGTDHKWELSQTAGVDDNYSMRFANIDARQSVQPSNQTETPAGLYADFYTQAYDLTNTTASTKLSYAYAGAYRTTNSAKMNDRLLVYYSVNCGTSWALFDSIVKSNIGNNGYEIATFTPSAGQWSYHGATLPLQIIGEDRVFFRFRFMPGVDSFYNNMHSSGNNFYIDRIGVNDYPLGITPAQLAQEGVILSPNPTMADARLIINGGGNNGTAKVRVTDITGKVVYSTTVQLSKVATEVMIPKESIHVKGMYVAEVITNGSVISKKLVVY